METIRFIAPACLAALPLATTSASAQSALFSDVDRNGNGVLSYNELVQSFGRAGADRIWSRGDGNGLSRGDITCINQDRDEDDDYGPGGRPGSRRRR